MRETSPRLLATTVAVVVLLAWPLIPGMPFDLVNTAILWGQNLIVVLSLVLLIGLVGQISLAQGALVGVGAFVAAQLTNHAGVRFPLDLVIGTAAGAVTAAAIGAVALRVRGLYLAVATLIFAYICDQYLFHQTWLVSTQTGTSIPAEAVGTPGALPYFNLADARTFYYVVAACSLLALYSVANIRDSRVGRAFAAVRGSEVGAASLGIDVTRYKLLGFACAGALAGFGGALSLAGTRTISPDQFNFLASLTFLAMAVVAGLRSVGGAVASSLLFALLVGEVFFRSPTLADYLDLISAGLLVVVLLFFQGGLGAVPGRLSSALARLAPAWAWLQRRWTGSRETRADGDSRSPAPAWWGTVRSRVSSAAARRPRLVRRDLREPAPAAVPAPPGTADGRIDVVALVRGLDHLSEGAATPPHLEVVTPATPRRDALDSVDAVAGEEGGEGRRLPALLEASGITVRFGGLVAVNDASLRVGAGEIVGLIGPNGAGKTTLFNAILGLNQPASGTVHLFGTDVSTWPVHRRAALGVGRTFQVLQLFSDMTVFDNLLVATHLQDTTGLWGGMWVTAAARRREAADRERVHAVLQLMELDQFAGKRVADLPFGVLRLVEVARTLVTGAPLVCFDEPASGLDSAETEDLIRWFQLLRRLGITLLVIEHDVSMVLRLCDYIYVLDQGRLLAEGTPDAIRRDQAVIDSYLGRADVA